jgi:hypothetical protein
VAAIDVPRLPYTALIAPPDTAAQSQRLTRPVQLPPTDTVNGKRAGSGFAASPQVLRDLGTTKLTGQRFRLFLRCPIYRSKLLIAYDLQGRIVANNLGAGRRF